MNKAESCVETPAAPEWLSKLESRREKLLSRNKLGHESGAGAPCNECGSKCPGLDLHFWRKVCRNCKCRKDQHMCPDDDFSGWAQFEILGQIRSKPAYMKIKALADNPVKLEWIPPNATPDLVSDYMDKLGDQIPIAGSDAALKRKQQLEFQVPPHDLDAELCDNLTENETDQLQQYVKRIRESCVGQGSVVRVGNIMRAIVGNMGPQIVDDSVNISTPMLAPPPEVLRILNAAPSQIFNDKIATEILNSQKVVNALLNEHASSPQKLIAFHRPRTPDFQRETFLSDNNKAMLTNMHVNKDMVKSLVENGPLYDNLILQLKNNHIDISHDPVLAPVELFRKNYLNDNDFQQDINRFVDFLNKISPQYATPIKSRPVDQDSFHSPIPLKNPIHTKFGSFMKQDTPMRKVKFGGVNVAYLMGLPVDASVERDSILSNIIHSEALMNSLQNPSSMLSRKNVVISAIPMVPDFSEENIHSPTREKLEKIGLNKQAVQSGVINGPFYDKLFDNLRQHGINYADCKLLAPIEEFREEFLTDFPFQKEIIEFVETLPNNSSISYSEPQPGVYYNQQHESPEHILSRNKYLDQPGFLSNPQSPFKSNLQGSRSSDSGFESKPPTPNYSTFPGSDNHSLLGIAANAGKFSSIPGLEDMNMYPQVQPTSTTIAQAEGMQNLNKSLDELHLPSDSGIRSSSHPVPVLDCKDCSKSIMSGEVAVKADRAGKEIAWHPQCFKCHKCRELLADLVYFFHGGNVYCGRDLAEILKIPRCNACDELIFTKEYTAAEGATFHVKHFCCYQCDTPLAGQGYVPDEKTNMPLCLQCYATMAERCQNCKNIIGPSEQGVAWGKVHWHGYCFKCSGLGCGKSLIGGRFCVKNNMPFCSPQCVKSIIH